ncbi:MAG: CRTAC1 family protein [Planctomycetota bacterium]|nr:CRTAC1 family protein [Planctomycetota bacterium]
MSQSKRPYLALLLVTFLTLGIAAAYFLFQPDTVPKPVDPNDLAAGGNPKVAPQNPQNGIDGQSDKQSNASSPKITREAFNKAVEALAAGEDLDFDRARLLWTELAEEYPEEDPFRINQGVVVLKWIDETESILSGGQIKDPDEIARFEKELETAYPFAEKAVEALQATDSDSSKAILLKAALLKKQASRLNSPDDDKVRRVAAKMLIESLKANPAQPLLVNELDDVLTVLGGLNPEEKIADLLPELREGMYACWQANQRSYYLITRCISLLSKAEDERLAEVLSASLQFTKSTWSEPTVARMIPILKPEQVVPKAIKAIREGNWKDANLRRMIPWENVIRGMQSAFQPDRKAMQPDILALLDAGFLNRLAKELQLPPPPPSTPPNFTVSNLKQKAEHALWFDVDIDLDSDLILIQGEKLQLIEHLEEGFSDAPISIVDVGWPIRGALIGEFFRSDSPGRRKSATVAELMQQVMPKKQASDEKREKVLTTEQLEVANRHDTLQEILVWGKEGLEVLLISTDGKHQLEKLDSATNLEEVKDVYAATILDLESDGDLDIFLLAGSGAQVWQNNGNRTFQNISEFSSFVDLPEDFEGAKLLSCDFDEDLDQDILFCSPRGDRVVFVENILHSQFRTRVLDAEHWPQAASPNSIAVAEVDQNASWDLVLGGSDSVQLTKTRSLGMGQIQATSSLTIDAPKSLQTEVHDFNNDGWVDIVSAGSSLEICTGSAVGFAAKKALSDSVAAPQQFAVADHNNDGSLDLVTISDGSVLVLTNQPTSQQHLNARVRGIFDENGGGRVNHFSYGTTLELWSEGRQMRRIVQTPVTHFGLGANDAQNMRIIFPNGLTQNLEKPTSNTLVQEVQELKGSCPFVYGWNGERFELITDLLWNAPLGLQIARGQTLPDRRWEHLAMPRRLMREKDGYYELRVTEELWEVAYFDQIELIAVDHPAGHELYTNEKVGPSMIAEPKIFLPQDKIFPVQVRDQAGRDVTEKLLDLDKDYVQAFDELLLQGLAMPHFVELDFGSKIPADSEGTDLRLILTGWMHPTDTSLNIGLSQNPELGAPEPPSLWVVDEEGNWVCAQPFMGFPGGKPKSIVVDLNDVFQSKDRRIRIGSSQQLYWDQAFIAIDSEQVESTSQSLELESAELRFRGFSQLMPRTIHQPHWYNYEDVSRQAKWPELEGPFTRFGSVLEQLQADDDSMIVMTSGDEVVLRFKVPSQKLPNGWERNFVLHCTGWDKDADLNTIAGQGSLPLPFMAQKSYPAGLDQEKESSEVWRKNADNLTRKRQIFQSAAEL